MNEQLPAALSRLSIAAALGGDATTLATVARADLKILLEQHGQLVESAQAGIRYYKLIMELQKSGIPAGTVVENNHELETSFDAWFSATKKALIPNAH